MASWISNRESAGGGDASAPPPPGAAVRVRSCSDRSRSSRGTSRSFSEEPLPLILELPIRSRAPGERRPHLLTDLLPDEKERLLHLADRHPVARRKLRVGRPRAVGAEREGLVDAEAILPPRSHEPLPHPADRLMNELLEPDALEHFFGIDVARLK